MLLSNITAKRLRDTLIDLFFPPRCALCDRLTDNPRNLLCAKCERESHKPDAIRMDGMFFDSVIAAFDYGNAVRDAVLRLKFRNRPDLAEPFGKLVAEAVASSGIAADIVTWIPLGEKRYKERGYNQAELLAKSAAEALGLPAKETLRRKRETAANSSLDSADERRGNVKDAFAVTDFNAISGKRVLLVDDVITSGSTLNECARELRLGGAETVVCALFASANAETNAAQVEN